MKGSDRIYFRERERVGIDSIHFPPQHQKSQLQTNPLTFILRLLGQEDTAKKSSIQHLIKERLQSFVLLYFIEIRLKLQPE